jgi:transcriptional regulator with XRE-family HTH domain
MDAKKLGKRIKLARVEADMTQADLAEATGILQKSVSRYETGTSLPTLETLERISKALKKPFGYFLDNDC